MSITTPDPVDVLSRLIACPSVTPDDAGALDCVEGILGAAGWRTERITFSEPGTPDVANLIATTGEGAPHLVFSGHVDVVPPGATAGWTRPPFSGAVEDGLCPWPRRGRHEGRHRRLHRGGRAFRRRAGRRRREP